MEKSHKELLALLHQKRFKANLTCGVLYQQGPSHMPTITVEYTTQWRVKPFQMTGQPGENKKVVLEQLAKQLFEKYANQ